MELETIGAVVLIGASGPTPQEALVHRAVQASVLDLLDVLNAQGVMPVIVAGPELDWVPDRPNLIRDVDSGPFHFGQRLADLIQNYSLSPVMYFGAGSTPLLNQDMMGLMHGMLYQSEYQQGGRIPTHIALTNNLRSSDWLGISHTLDALSIIRTAPRDNRLAWLLQENWDFDVRVLAGVRPASSMDLDTPSDLAIVRQHPLCPPYLLDAAGDSALDWVPVEPIIELSAGQTGQLALVGRVSPLAWQALSKASACQIRVFAEEHRMDDEIDTPLDDQLPSAVQSLMGKLYAALGPDNFFAELAKLVDGAIIDSRVLMAAAGQSPSLADRFASDLGWIDAIENEWLRTFTAAADRASIPVLLGGNGVVTGGLYALADIVAERRQQQAQARHS